MLDPKMRLKSGLLSLGINATKTTNQKDLLALIRKLRPLDCGVELIRVGAPTDGGYLIPNDLSDIKYCFSPGVNTISAFEDDLADKGIQSFLADYSVKELPMSRHAFTFDKMFLGACDRDHFFTLGSWKAKYLGDSNEDLILQMDIEGAEYEVILSAPDSLLSQFRIMVIEFHYLDWLFDPFSFRLISSCFDKLLEHFNVVHIHPNNSFGFVRRGIIKIPRLLEFTFLNKKRASRGEPILNLPHPLDADNEPGPTLPLPKCWYNPE